MTVREAVGNEPKIGATIGVLESIMRSEYNFTEREEQALSDSILFLREFRDMLKERLDSMELK